MKGCPNLLDLIPLERGECHIVKREEETRHEISEEKKLELSLGPPGGEWTITDKNSSHTKTSREMDHESFLSSDNLCAQNPVLKSTWQQQTRAHVLQLQSMPQLQFSVMKESSQPCSIKRAAMELQSAEKKISSSPATANTASTAQKRTAPAPVVGWPPVRSFRKNIASGSTSKSASESPKVVPNLVSAQKKPVQNSSKGLFVKVNMDGIPIGRKVDLKSCNGYEKLSYAVDELFRGLLAAQSDSSAGGTNEMEEGRKKTSGLLDGSGEYTLVYEDNEGDRMLVGDVPWNMFILTVKRLRVLKSSELPTLSTRVSKHGKLFRDEPHN